MTHIITYPNGEKLYSSSLVDIAEKLTKYFVRKVYVSDFELQLDPPECDFIVYGLKFHFKQYED